MNVVLLYMEEQSKAHCAKKFNHCNEESKKNVQVTHYLTAYRFQLLKLCPDFSISVH